MRIQCEYDLYGLVIQNVKSRIHLSGSRTENGKIIHKLRLTWHLVIGSTFPININVIKCSKVQNDHIDI